MNEFNEEINLILLKSNIKKNPHLIPVYQKSGKNSFILYRKEMVQTIKHLHQKYVNNNNLGIFYLSVLYLDIILSKNKILLIIENNRKLLCLCCFILSLKFIGESNNSEKIIKNYLKTDFPPYSIFETKCLYLLDYNLIYTTTYDYLNIILLKSDPKILFTSKTILYSYIENNSYINYCPFLTSISIIKYSKFINGNNSKILYDEYFEDNIVKHIELILQNEFKDIENKKNNISIEDDKIWDMKTMASTVERLEQRRISMSNNKRKDTIRLFNNDFKKININPINLNNDFIKDFKDKDKNNNIIVNNNSNFNKNDNNNSSRKRNFSLNKTISTQYNYNANNRFNNFNINRINIDLGQISKIPFDKLAKLSVRYLKTEK